jgi:arginine repressor
MFEELDKKNTDVTQGSTVTRWMNYLRRVKAPLEELQGVLELASPLTALEPTSAIVFGVTRSVTVVSSTHHEIVTISGFPGVLM